eukprot:scaffold6358_cov267-Pinguiococcus_pyrenoidosus.AAC.7
MPRAARRRETEALKAPTGLFGPSPTQFLGNATALAQFCTETRRAASKRFLTLPWRYRECRRSFLRPPWKTARCRLSSPLGHSSRWTGIARALLGFGTKSTASSPDTELWLIRGGRGRTGRNAPRNCAERHAKPRLGSRDLSVARKLTEPTKLGMTFLKRGISDFVEFEMPQQKAVLPPRRCFLCCHVGQMDDAFKISNTKTTSDF